MIDRNRIVVYIKIFVYPSTNKIPKKKYVILIFIKKFTSPHDVITLIGLTRFWLGLGYKYYIEYHNIIIYVYVTI